MQNKTIVSFRFILLAGIFVFSAGTALAGMVEIGPGVLMTVSDHNDLRAMVQGKRPVTRPVPVTPPENVAIGPDLVISRTEYEGMKNAVRGRMPGAGRLMVAKPDPVETIGTDLVISKSEYDAMQKSVQCGPLIVEHPPYCRVHAAAE